MREKPGIPDERLRTTLQHQYDLGEETRADIARLFHEILLGNTSTINDVYAAAAHLPTDLTLE